MPKIQTFGFLLSCAIAVLRSQITTRVFDAHNFIGIDTDNPDVYSEIAKLVRIRSDVVRSVLLATGHCIQLMQALELARVLRIVLGSNLARLRRADALL